MRHFLPFKMIYIKKPSNALGSRSVVIFLFIPTDRGHLSQRKNKNNHAERTSNECVFFFDGGRTGVPLFPSSTIGQELFTDLSKKFSNSFQLWGYESANTGLILVPCSLISRIFPASYNKTSDFFGSFSENRLTKIKHGQSSLSTWNAIWCGETDMRLLLLTFNSTVNNLPSSVNPNRSGTPCVAQDSILTQRYLGRFFFTCFQKFVSGLATVNFWGFVSLCYMGYMSGKRHNLCV